MDELQKLRVRNEIQSVFIKELSTKKQQHQNAYVPSMPIHEPYIHQQIQQHIPTNSLDNTTFTVDYQQYQ